MPSEEAHELPTLQKHQILEIEFAIKALQTAKACGKYLAAADSRSFIGRSGSSKKYTTLDSKQNITLDSGNRSKAFSCVEMGSPNIGPTCVDRDSLVTHQFRPQEKG